MPPVEPLIILSTASLTGLAMVAATATWAWSAWLKLKARELEQFRPGSADTGSISQRIDLADLKERIRKLEAIAAGVDI
ncbi:MAG: hypothetical protein WCO82_06250 [Sphingomonadales bacterium]|jgi:hypothetical protein